MDLAFKQIVLRLFMAMLIGTIVGFERTRARKPAGIRTHSLVCIAFTMVTIVSAYGFEQVGHGQVTDPARLIAQAVTGIGFLGAGIIFKHEGEIRGLTTATNVWTVAGLGIAIGLGHFSIALVTIVLMLISLKMASILQRLGILKYKGH